MKFDFYKRIIDTAADLKVPSVKLNWRGEPLLNPQLEKFIKYAKDNGILEVSINTNATHLTKERSQSLIDSGLDLIIYSFDGGTKKTYEISIMRIEALLCVWNKYYAYKINSMRTE